MTANPNPARIADGLRALAILDEIERSGVHFKTHRARPLSYAAEHEWEYYAEVYLSGEMIETTRHRSLLGVLAGIVEMVRESRVGPDVDDAFEALEWGAGT